MSKEEKPTVHSDRLLRLTSRIKKFDGNNEEGWDVWIQRFELLAGLGDKSQWLESLFICLDGKALDVCTSMPEQHRGKYDEVKKALNARFGKDVNTIHAYSDLNQAIRQVGETFEDFGDRIQELTKRAFPDRVPPESAMVNQFLCGLREPWLQAKLMDKSLPTLDDALKEVRTLRKTRDALAAIGAVGGADYGRQGQNEQALVAKAQITPEMRSLEQKVDMLQDRLEDVLGLVASIGDSGVVPKNPKQGKGREARCYGCGEPGHFKRDCPQGSGRRAGRNMAGTPEPFCLCCGKAGHWMADCRKRPDHSGQKQSEN